MDTDKPKAPAPPYVAYRTLANFLERFKTIVPGRIDVKMMGNSMSGGVRAQVLAALKSLRLVNDNGFPQDDMKKLCTSEGAQRQEILKRILHEGYPFVFGNGFDFSNTTSSQLRELFEANTSASGETVSRCINFLKDAAQDAGIAVSPFLNDPKNRAPAAAKKRSAKRPVAPSMPEPHTVASHPQSQPGAIPAQESLLLWGVFQRLPKPGSVWKKSEREQWLTTLTNIIGLEYKDAS